MSADAQGRTISGTCSVAVQINLYNWRGGARSDGNILTGPVILQTLLHCVLVAIPTMLVWSNHLQESSLSVFIKNTAEACRTRKCCTLCRDSSQSSHVEARAYIAYVHVIVSESAWIYVSVMYVGMSLNASNIICMDNNSRLLDVHTGAIHFFILKCFLQSLNYVFAFPPMSLMR